jgi:four helix bundle protein
LGHSYRDLVAWQKSKDLATMIYRETRSFPTPELYGLVSQLRRAAVSVPSNIAEGQGRLTKGEFRHFLGIARGSVLELQTQLEISYELGYLAKERHKKLIQASDEVLRIINALSSSLRDR